MALPSLRTSQWLSPGSEGSIEIPPHRPFMKMCAAHLVAPPQASVGPESPKKQTAPASPTTTLRRRSRTASCFVMCLTSRLCPLHWGSLQECLPTISWLRLSKTFSVINLKLTVDVESKVIGHHSSRTQTRGREGRRNIIVRYRSQYRC